MLWVGGEHCLPRLRFAQSVVVITADSDEVNALQRFGNGLDSATGPYHRLDTALTSGVDGMRTPEARELGGSSSSCVRDPASRSRPGGQTAKSMKPSGSAYSIASPIDSHN